MNEKEEKIQRPKNSILFENEEYNKALVLKDQTIAEKDQTIAILTSQIGQRDQIISVRNKELEEEKTGRITAESQLADKKELKVEHKGNYYKTEEEKFADAFEKDWNKLSN